MAVLEQEPDPRAVSSLPKLEVISVPADYAISVYFEEDEDENYSTDPGRVRIIEAFWEAEPKVRAELDIFNGEAYLNSFGRPSHWGADVRLPQEQQKEYRLAMDGMLRRAMGNRRIRSLAVNRISGPAAAALIELPCPDGWQQSMQLKFDGPVNIGLLDLSELIQNGGILTAHYERVPVAPVALGTIAAEGLVAVTDAPAA